MIVIVLNGGIQLIPAYWHRDVGMASLARSEYTETVVL